MALTLKLPRGVDVYAALPQSDYTENKLLGSAGTAETITVPKDASNVAARFVLLSGTAAFSAKFGTAAVTATQVDTTVGDGSMVSPTFRKILDGQTHISVVSATANCVISAEFFLDIPVGA